MTSDMVFDHNHNPAWCDSPDSVKNYLEHRIARNPESVNGWTVRISFPPELLTVAEYLGAKKPQGENTMEFVTVYRRTYSAKAVRITNENIRELADFIGGAYSEEPSGVKDDKNHYPVIRCYGGTGRVGDWYVYLSDIHLFFSDQQFTGRFHTHEQELAENEKYARVYVLVKSAMSKQDAATYHGDSSGMDLIAAEISRKILEAL